MADSKRTSAQAVEAVQAVDAACNDGPRLMDFMEVQMIQSEAPPYPGLSEPDRQTIRRALEVLKASIARQVFDRPGAVKDYLTLKYAGLQYEVFGALWLDAHVRLLSEDVLFRGTLTQTSVYPREVAKQGLLRNAGGVILFHNHPLC